MPRIITVCLAILFITVPSIAQNGSSGQHVTSDPPSLGRYEVIQCPMNRRLIFRLDLYTGDVDQMVMNTEGISVSWLPIFVDSKPTISNANSPRFMMFLSGLRVFDKFLIDSSTGATWNLQEASGHPRMPDGTMLWIPIRE